MAFSCCFAEDGLLQLSSNSELTRSAISRIIAGAVSLPPPVCFRFIAVCLLSAIACAEPPPEVTREIGVSTLVLTLPQRFGQPHRPPVEFDHPAHVEAIHPRSCDTCHRPGGSWQIPLAQGADDAETAMNAYHTLCLGCHKKVYGPVTCASCHVRGRRWKSAPPAKAFGEQLHDRHITALDEACDRCHHVYDTEAKKLVHEPGAEAACADCHPKIATESAIALKDAVHRTCVNCHLQRHKNNKTTGNEISCIACHTP